MAALWDESRIQAEGNLSMSRAAVSRATMAFHGGVPGRLQEWIRTGPKAQEP